MLNPGKNATSNPMPTYNNKSNEVRVYSFKPIPFLVAFFFGMCILLTHFSENDRVGKSPKPSTAKSRRFSRLLRDLRFVGKLAILPRDSRIFRIHILLNFEILFVEACRFQEYALSLTSRFVPRRT